MDCIFLWKMKTNTQSAMSISMNNKPMRPQHNNKPQLVGEVGSQRNHLKEVAQALE